MKIKAVQITNIKGISNKAFNLDLAPNKPSILVAPNGFGKSSFGIGFGSLKRDKIEIHDKNYHLGSDANRPSLSLTVEDDKGTRVLIANDGQNSISDEFDVFVINSQLVAKAVKLNLGGNVIAKASLEISPIVLIPTIPAKVAFNYNITQVKKDFGNSGKIMPNISWVFGSAPLLYKIVSNIDLNKFGQVKISKSIAAIQQEINQQNGTIEVIKSWIEQNKLPELRGVKELNELAQIVTSFDSQNSLSETEGFLAAFQIISMFNSLGANFKKAVNYTCYLDEKAYYEHTISQFNTTRYTIRPKEDKNNGLIVEWPKAHEISNGQRDILSFITLLMKAKRNFRKKNCILIIDEIFDYLDDANLISFQYFITEMIEEMKGHKNFFSVLLTHLDPMYFNHFCFNKHKLKIIYLKDVAANSNINILNLIKKREEASIQTLADTHFFHYHPTHTDISAQFTALNLPGPWGNSQRFHEVIKAEVDKYLNGQADFCPLAICFGVRVRIESLIHNKIADPAHKQIFLNTHGTKKKLDYCETIGLEVPHSYHLLGIIYNDRLHWRDGLDIVRPVAIKLENLTIRKLIRDIFR